MKMRQGAEVAPEKIKKEQELLKNNNTTEEETNIAPGQLDKLAIIRASCRGC